MILENTPSLETERLILRKFTETDLEAYFEIMRDECANRFLPWFPVRTLGEADRFLHENCLNEYRKASAYRYAVCLKEVDVPIGYCGFSGTASNDIGYGLKSEFWHRGIMTEAASALVGRIERAGYPFVTATHDRDNPHSGEVMKKIGMTYRYSYVEQWQPKDIPVTFRMYQLDFDGKEKTYSEYWNTFENHFVEEKIMQKNP